MNFETRLNLRQSLFASIALFVLFICSTPVYAQSTGYDEGLKLYKAGQYAAAAAKLLGAVKYPGKEGSAYYYLGCCYYRLNRAADARAIYRTVVNDYPTAPEAPLAQQMLKRLDPTYVPPVRLADNTTTKAAPAAVATVDAAVNRKPKSGAFPGEDFSKLPDEARIPFTLDTDGQHMKVKVFLEGRPLDAWFDTGANGHFGKNHLIAAGVPVPRGAPNSETSGWAGNAVPVWYQPMRVGMGNVTRYAPVTVEEDMAMLPLVGQEFIQGYQCEIDNNSHFIVLRKASAFKPTSSQTSSLYDVPCIRRGMRDYVTMAINGKKLEVLIDTGADSSMFNAEDLNGIGIRVPDDAPRSSAGGVGGSFSVQKMWVECRLGPIWKKDFPISVGGSAGSAIGQDLLKTQRFTIDREQNLMRFFH